MPAVLVVSAHEKENQEQMQEIINLEAMKFKTDSSSRQGATETQLKSIVIAHAPCSIS